ncbi:MAG: hypothetical protein A2X36_02870 [Elusimicrobia bacterium GWA2_69_24]|nr:MAG: hypothetical protein A2X36_02870 [Elusimicrobia bacterium GWA2_69_24]HBL16336.1 hypothetical protein [Elusimicrobiota bacterium]
MNEPITESTDFFLRSCVRCARWACVATASAACAALAGCWLDLPILAGGFGASIPMAPSTAAAFICLAAVLHPDLPWYRSPRVRGALGAAVLVLAAPTVLGFLTQAWGRPGILPALDPRQKLWIMSPVTGLCFLALGFSVLLQPGTSSGRRSAAAKAGAAAVLAMSFILLLGYVYDQPFFYGGTIVPMALTTAACFFFVSGAFFVFGGPSIWPLDLFAGTSLSARIMRWSVPILTGIFLLEGFADSRLSLHVLTHGILTLSSLAAMAMSVFLISRRLEASIAATQKDLRESEAKFRRLVEGLQREFFFYRHGTDGIFSYLSPSIKAILGYDPEEFLTHYSEYLTDDPVNQEVVAHTELSMKGLQQPPYLVEILHKDGSRHWLRVLETPIFDEGRRVVAVEGVAQDITERKRAEEELNRAQGLGAAVLDSIEDHILILDIRDHRILGANQAFLDAYGLTRDQALGRTCYELTHSRSSPCVGPDDTCPLQEMVAAGATSRTDHLHRTPDGEERLFEVAVHPIKTPGRAVERVVHISRDITEGRRKDRERLQLQKLESLGVLAGGIAHDFNNILTSILGNLSLLRVDLKSGEPLELAREAEDACQTAKGLARQLLTFASGGEPVVRTADVVSLVRSVAAFAVRGTGIKVVFSGEAGPLFARMDRDQVAQVVQNLCINAAQAMPQGGTITLVSSAIHLAAGALGSLPAGPYVRVTVQDAGTGIPAEILPRIFDPYFSTKGKGRGLGLAVCHSIVAKHGGALTVDSRPGEGARFTIALPAAAPDSARQEVSAPPPPTPRGGRILVMDDDDAVARVLERMLRHLGYQAETVPDGRRTLEAYAAARDTGRPFAGVIMDLTIVGGMGGEEAVRLLLAADPEARVIVSSGYSNAPIMADYAAHGFCGVLSKPYRIEEVAAALSQALAPTPHP